MPNLESTSSGRSRGLLVLWTVLILLDFSKHMVMVGADPPPPQLDAFAYWRLGGQLADGDWLLREESGAFRTPGYPAFLAPFRALLGSYAMQGTLVAQHLLVMATSLLTAAACGRLTGRHSWAILAYVLSMLCYSRDWHANLLLSETLFTFVLTACGATLIAYLAAPSALWAVLMGALVGLATLARPIATYLWIPLALTIATAPRWHRIRARGGDRFWSTCRRRASHVALTVVAVHVVLAPWFARNQVLFGRPFMTSFLGRNLWVATFEKGSGANLTLGDGPASSVLKERLAGVAVGVAWHDTWSVSGALAAAGVPDDEIDELMLRVCREEISRSPATAAYKTFRRIVNFWRCVSNPFPFYDWRNDQADYAGQRLWKSPFVTAAYRRMNEIAFSRFLRMNELVIAFVVMGVIGLSRRGETRSVAIGLGLILLYFNIVTATFEIPSYRYRMVLEPIMIICFVGGSAAWLPGGKAER